MSRRIVDLFIKVFVVLSFALPTPFIHAQFMFPQKNKTAQLQQQQLEQMRASLSNSMTSDIDSDDATKPTSSAQPTASKKVGVTRIGIVMPTNNLEGKGKPQDGEPLRQALKQLLVGPNIEAVSIKALLPEQALEEAKLLDCDYVLTASITQQQIESQGHFSKFGSMRAFQMAATAAQFVPGVGATAMMANAALTTVASQNQAQSLTRLSSSVKANSEITLNYSLSSPVGSSVLADKEVVRCKSDGDDVITAMLTASAQKIVKNVK